MSKQQKNVIIKEDLILEIATALKDVFVAQIESNEQGVVMHFTNGQTFTVSVQ